MPRRRRSCSAARPLLSRYPLTVDLAVAIARAAADDQPAFVVLVFDETGVLLAVRPHDLAPDEVEESCCTLLGLLAPEGRGPAVLVSVDPGFGTEVEPALAVWPDVAGAFDEAGATLLDWLLVCDDRVSSVATAAGTPAGW
jgi:hypothetical protein